MNLAGLFSNLTPKIETTDMIAVGYVAAQGTSVTFIVCRLYAINEASLRFWSSMSGRLKLCWKQRMRGKQSRWDALFSNFT